MSNHTPGPWMHLSGGHITTTAGADWARHVVADIRSDNEGDARLIAAAPDLLAALDALLLAGYGMKNAPGVFSYADAFNQAAERAHAAIAKAEGRHE